MPEAPDVLAPAKLGPITLRNRIIKSATFEARTPGALVSDDLIEFHRLPAAGGVGMTTVAYCAVSQGGRTEGNGIWMRPEAVPGFRRLTDAIHAEGAAVCAQIGHAGPVANARSNKATALAPVRFFNPIGMRFAKKATRDDIDDVIAAHANAARLAVDAGFDAVEVHLGHNYLASAFLSPLINRRNDEFGGSLENRAKVARGMVMAVKHAVKDQIAVTAKLNMADGVPGGFWLDESVEFARMLESQGALDALELTGGSSLSNPMYLFRGEAPRAEFAATLPAPLRLGFRAVGSRFLQAYPFEEAFFLPYARQFLEALSMPLILLGGVNRLGTVEGALAEGFAFVAMARALLREPDLVGRWERGDDAAGLCIHCNKCMPTIYSGTRCVLVPDADPV